MFLTAYQYVVDQKKALLAEAEQTVKQLKADYDQASANVEKVNAQVRLGEDEYHRQEYLFEKKVVAQAALDVATRNLDGAKQALAGAVAGKESARLAYESEIGGVNTTVAQIQAQLEHAKWELDQTTIRAPGDGYVTVMALAVGDRALQARSVMSFIVTDDITIIGMFSPNGFQTIKPDAPVKLVFDTHPGRIYHAKITSIPHGVGQGQVAVSGMLARVGSIGGAKAYPAEISIPGDIDRAQLRLGMPGTATVFAENAGVIGLLMSILVWISSYTAYL